MHGDARLRLALGPTRSSSAEWAPACRRVARGRRLLRRRPRDDGRPRRPPTASSRSAPCGSSPSSARRRSSGWSTRACRCPRRSPALTGIRRRAVARARARSARRSTGSCASPATRCSSPTTRASTSASSTPRCTACAAARLACPVVDTVGLARRLLAAGRRADLGALASASTPRCALPPRAARRRRRPPSPAALLGLAQERGARTVDDPSRCPRRPSARCAPPRAAGGVPPRAPGIYVMRDGAGRRSTSARPPTCAGACARTSRGGRSGRGRARAARGRAPRVRDRRLRLRGAPTRARADPRGLRPPRTAAARDPSARATCARARRARAALAGVGAAGLAAGRHAGPLRSRPQAEPVAAALRARSACACAGRGRRSTRVVPRRRLGRCLRRAAAAPARRTPRRWTPPALAEGAAPRGRLSRCAAGCSARAPIARSEQAARRATSWPRSPRGQRALGRLRRARGAKRRVLAPDVDGRFVRRSPAPAGASSPGAALPRAGDAGSRPPRSWRRSRTACSRPPAPCTPAQADRPGSWRPRWPAPAACARSPSRGHAPARRRGSSGCGGRYPCGVNFGDRVAEAVERKRSCLCVGLDPRIDLLPPA